MGSLNKNWQ